MTRKSKPEAKKKPLIFQSENLSREGLSQIQMATCQEMLTELFIFSRKQEQAVFIMMC